MIPVFVENGIQPPLSREQIQEQKKERSLEGGVALITGGSRGIGAAIARRLAEAGASAAVTSVDSTQAAERVAAEVREEGVEAEAIRAVCRNIDSCKPRRQLLAFSHRHMKS